MNGLAVLLLTATLGQDAALNYDNAGALEWTLDFDAQLLEEMKDGSEAESHLEDPKTPPVDRFRLRVVTKNTTQQRREVIASKEKGIRIGWEPNNSGGLRYIVQLDPSVLEWLKSGAYEITDEIDRSVANVRDLVVRVGTGKVPRLMDDTGRRGNLADQRFASESPRRAPTNSLDDDAGEGRRTIGSGTTGSSGRFGRPAGRLAADDTRWPTNGSRSVWDVFGAGAASSRNDRQQDERDADYGDERVGSTNRRWIDDARRLDSNQRETGDDRDALADDWRDERRTNAVGYKPADRSGTSTIDRNDRPLTKVARTTGQKSGSGRDQDYGEPALGDHDSDHEDERDQETGFSAADDDAFGLGKGSSTSSRSKERDSTAKKKTERGTDRLAADPSFGPLLLFFLCASLGVNVYLIWINRGFYHRYHGLLSEMRSSA